MRHFEVDVMFAGSRAKLHFFYQHLRLIFPRLLDFLLLQIAELAIVHDPADRRRRCRRHLNQIEFFAFRKTQCFSQGQDADLLPIGLNDPDFTRADLLIDPYSCFFCCYGAPPGMRSAFRRSISISTERGEIFPPLRPRGATVAVLTSLSPITTI